VQTGNASCARTSDWKRPTWFVLSSGGESYADAKEPQCVLCPKDLTTLIAKIKSKKAPSDFDILSAMKPTEGLRWAHILCSTWMPDVLFADAAKFKMVEGIMSLPEERWSTVRIWAKKCRLVAHSTVTYARLAHFATSQAARP